MVDGEVSDKGKKQAGRRRKQRKQKASRPKENSRRGIVGVRLSVDEMKQLVAQAKSHGVKKATYLRAVWLGQPITKVPMPEVMGPAVGPARQLSVAELAAYQQLVEAATNLNAQASSEQLDSHQQQETQKAFEQLRYFLAQLVPPRSEPK
jgi:ferritin-like metal-binding protein YciE